MFKYIQKDYKYKIRIMFYYALFTNKTNLIPFIKNDIFVKFIGKI